MLSYIIPFLILILVVVFIHEYGHFYFARKYGVGVTDFSIGFGKELFGWNDKSGTRWKICAIPLGGYVKFFGDRNVYSQADHHEILEKYTRSLFKKGSELANERGLILVDTKYEFGKTKDGKIVLIDEIHTPDSSRYFYSDGYSERQIKNEPQKQLSKEFLRQWLISNNFQGLEGQNVPNMSDEYVKSVSDRYIELYENITSEIFVKSDLNNIKNRIFTNTENYLKEYFGV